MQFLSKSGVKNSVLLFMLVFISLWLKPSSEVKGQLNSFSISLGMITTSFNAGSPAEKLMFDMKNYDSLYTLGGSFDGSQPGISLTFTYSLDETSTFVMPIGFDFSLFRASEKLNGGVGETFYFKHSINLASTHIGLNYFMFKFPIANVRAYAGLEARMSWLMSPELTQKQVKTTSEPDSVIIRRIKPKSADEFRLGGALRIGFEGEIQAPIFINTSFGWGVMNLFMRDANRGELLSPLPINEREETLVYNYLFSLMIQYKF